MARALASGLPSAGFGALLTLMLFHMDLNVYALVGIIMLVGIVKKNATMMIDFALEAQHTEGKEAEQAIFERCLIRFRPIMMTTMAALMETLPIVLGAAAGSDRAAAGGGGRGRIGFFPAHDSLHHAGDLYVLGTGTTCRRPHKP
jgi:HAE1 family hydrophobic/amphiphilic exporter-1